MASVSLSHIYKVYPNGLKAVSDFSMDIQDREFIVFVGPSGCGKSTTLRMIAGLEDITAGELRIDGEVVNYSEPKDRDIAMVFQNYALYPHMRVFDNMAFGLQLRHLPKDEIKSRVNEAAKILGITDYLNKKPKEMSGGQRQRVALGRAMVREPKVFLLDEPLSNLDAKLRTQMRSEILKLHERIKTTFIYVTHDQVEAMTMGTRIVVMKDGFVQQIDTPRNLYSYPVNKFVAGFIGTPQMNFYKGKMSRNGDNVELCFDGTEVKFTAPYELFAKTDREHLYGEKPVIFGIRSEHISVDPDKYPYKARCKVSYCEDLGIDSQVYADFNLADEEIDGSLESETKAVIKAPAATMYDKGQLLDVSLDLSTLQIFDAETEMTVAPRIPTRAVFDGVVKNGKIDILGTEFALPPAINLEDGEYKVEAEARAMSPDGKLKAKLLDYEKIGDVTLFRYKAKDTVFFVQSPDATRKGSGVNLDLSRCSFIKDGEVVVAAMPEYNSLECKFHKRKERENAVVDGETKLVSVKKYSLGFEAYERKITAAKTEHGRITCVKNAVYGTEITVEVSPEEGYALKRLAAGNVDITYGKKFIMPDDDVVVTATFVPQSEHESAEQSNEQAEAPTEAIGESGVAAENAKPKDKGKKKGKAVVRYSIDCKNEDAQRIMAGAGRPVYKDTLEVRFSPDAVAVSDEGITAFVEEVRDYGNDKFAKCRVGEETVFVAVDGDFDKDLVKLTLDAKKLSVYDKTIDIRLV